LKEGAPFFHGFYVDRDLTDWLEPGESTKEPTVLLLPFISEQWSTGGAGRVLGGSRTDL
jgi:hypothetical protein